MGDRVVLCHGSAYVLQFLGASAWPSMSKAHLSNSELRHAAGLLHSVHADAANAVCRARTINEEKPDCSGSFEYRRRDSNPRHADYDRGNRAPNAASCVNFRRVG